MPNNTIFHKIINGEIPCAKVYEDDLCIAIRDVNPVSSTHILVIPKEDIVNLDEVKENHKHLLGHMLVTTSEIAKKENISEDGYRIVINTGEFGGQTVFQLHMHLLGGRPFAWPPG